MGTSIDGRRPGGIGDRNNLVAQQALGLFNAALQIADRIHFAEIDADRDDGLGDFRRQTGHDHVGAQQPRCFHGLHQVIGDGRIHCRHAGDVDDHHFGAVHADAAQQLLRQLPCSLRIDDSDDGTNPTATVLAMRLAAGS
jgi:hypothetical protein